MQNTNSSLNISCPIGSTLTKLMVQFYNAHPKKTIMLAGPSGAGKSQVISQLGEQMNMPVLTIYGSQVQDQFNIVIPMPDGSLKSVRPDDLIGEINGGAVIVFLDEFNHMDSRGMKLMYQLLLDHKIGSHVLPEGSIVVGARNGAKDGANTVQGKIPAPVQNRICTIEVSVGKDELLSHFEVKDIDPRIRAFLRVYPESIHKFTPGSTELNFPTPRAWEDMDRLMSMYKSNPHGFTLLSAGTLGESTSVSFGAFMSIMDGLPSMKKILKGKETVIVSDIKIAWGYLGMVETQIKSIPTMTDKEVYNLVDYTLDQQLTKEISDITFKKIAEGLLLIMKDSDEPDVSRKRYVTLLTTISRKDGVVATRGSRMELSQLIESYKNK